MIPIDFELNIFVSKEYVVFAKINFCSPKLSAWRGGSRFASNPNYKNLVVTKEEYEEGEESVEVVVYIEIIK